MSEALIQLTKHVIREEGLQGCTLLVLGERGAHDIPPYGSEEDGRRGVYRQAMGYVERVFIASRGDHSRGSLHPFELAAWGSRR